MTTAKLYNPLLPLQYMLQDMVWLWINASFLNWLLIVILIIITINWPLIVTLLSAIIIDRRLHTKQTVGYGFPILSISTFVLARFNHWRYGFVYMPDYWDMWVLEIPAHPAFRSLDWYQLLGLLIANYAPLYMAASIAAINLRLQAKRDIGVLLPTIAIYSTVMWIVILIMGLPFSALHHFFQWLQWAFYGII